MSDEPVFIDALGRKYRSMPGPCRVQDPVYFTFWINKAEREAIRRLAQLNQTTMSDLLRSAVNSIASECGSRRVFPPSDTYI